MSNKKFIKITFIRLPPNISRLHISSNHCDKGKLAEKSAIWDIKKRLNFQQ